MWEAASLEPVLNDKGTRMKDGTVSYRVQVIVVPPPQEEGGVAGIKEHDWREMEEKDKYLV